MNLERRMRMDGEMWWSFAIVYKLVACSGRCNAGEMTSGAVLRLGP